MITRVALLVAVALSPVLARGASTAGARLLDPQGKEVGTATFEAGTEGVKIEVNASGLSPGKHGFHVHAVGKCEAPDFKSAGPHFNPGGKKHGHDNPEGAHAGDLPNLEVAADKKGKATFVAKGLAFDSLFAGSGTSLVLHADPDDGKTDPAGNSGARIACGVIERGK